MKTYSLVVGNGHLEVGAGSLPAPAIMHTAATPRSSLGADLMHAPCESRRGSGAFVEPGSCDQRSPVSGRLWSHDRSYDTQYIHIQSVTLILSV